MNTLDVVILGTLLIAALGGYRLGFVARIFSWAGLVLGLLLAAHFLPGVVRRFDQSDSQMKLLIATGFLLGVSMLAQAVGLAFGSLVHATLPLGAGLRQGDRVLGAVLGGCGVLVMVWVITPAFVNTSGWAARESRQSAVVRFVDQLMPQAPNAVKALKRIVGDQQFDVFQSLKPNRDAGAPPPAGLAPAVNQRVIQSTVKVVGDACGKIQEGSGFAIQPDTIVTNAHVVAGERDTRVETPRSAQGRGLRATVVYFDPNHDLAVLHVANLNEPALPVAKIRVGQAGAVYGHPGGGPLVPAPAKVVQQVRAEGTDIYDRNRSVRNVFILASELHPGDSGGALVDQAGNAVGVAFAIAPDKPTTAYALTDTELRAVLNHGSTPVSTGPCLSH